MVPPSWLYHTILWVIPRLETQHLMNRSLNTYYVIDVRQVLKAHISTLFWLPRSTLTYFRNNIPFWAQISFKWINIDIKHCPHWEKSIPNFNPEMTKTTSVQRIWVSTLKTLSPCCFIWQILVQETKFLLASIKIRLT